MPCDHRSTESLDAQVRYMVLALDTAHCSSAGSEFILPPEACHANVLQAAD